MGMMQLTILMREQRGTKKMSKQLREQVEKAIQKLDWMLAPGQTRREAVEILKKALASSEEKK